jgi:hypothetical protein
MLNETGIEHDTPRGAPRADGSPDPAAGSAIDHRKGDATSAQVTDPVGLLRIASMVKKVDDQLDTIELDAAAAERLEGMAHDVRADLAHAVSGDLLDEYDRLVGDARGARSVAETALVHAQLTGWLDGVMQGLQLQAASAQAARAQRRVDASTHARDAEPRAPRRDNRYI